MDDLQACRDLLKRLQWKGVTWRWDTALPSCPVCLAMESGDRGHAPNCELARLAGIKPKPRPLSPQEQQIVDLKAIVARLEAELSATHPTKTPEV